MTALGWIILVIAAVIIAWFLFKKCKKCKKGSNLPQNPQGPTTPTV